MSAIYRKSGDVIQFTPQADVPFGVFVTLGKIVGITKFPVKSGKVGVIATAGLFDNVAKHGTSNALTDGQIVYLNPTDGKIYNAAATGYLPCGYAVGAATATSTTCSIFLTPLTCESTTTVNHTYVGQTITHTPSGAVTAGSLLAVGSLVGYAADAIAANTAGTLQVSGVITDAPKHGTSNALTDGQIVFLNPTNGKIYNANATGYIPCGYAVGAATASATKCNVLLWPGLEAAAS